jgi:hypothetical protein
VPEPTVLVDFYPLEPASNRPISRRFERIPFWHNTPPPSRPSGPAQGLKNLARSANVDHGSLAGPDPWQRRQVFAAGCVSLVMAAVAPLVAAEVDTATKPVEVDFEGPDGCSGAKAFFSSLRSRTNHVRQAEADEARAILRVRLSREHGQVIGELRMIDNHGGTDTLKVQGASCNDVVQALSLTAALALDPTSVLSVPRAAPSAVAAATGVPANPAEVLPAVKQPVPVPLAAAETPSTSAPSPLPSFELGAGPVGLAVLSGSFSPGISVVARKTLGGDGAFHPTLGLALAYVRNDVLESPQAARVALAGIGASACPVRWTASVLRVQPCALLLAGWLRATGRQMTHAGTVDRLWLSAGLTIRVAAFLGRGFSLELEGGINAPLVKRRFYATVPSNVVAETPTLSPVVGIGPTYGW